MRRLHGVMKKKPTPREIASLAFIYGGLLAVCVRHRSNGRKGMVLAVKFSSQSVAVKFAAYFRKVLGYRHTIRKIGASGWAVSVACSPPGAVPLGLAGRPLPVKSLKSLFSVLARLGRAGG